MAGAQLAAYTGLNPQALDGTGLPPGTVRGVIAVSGAGLDLMDAGTYALGHRPDYYQSIIDPAKTNQAWQQEGLAVSYIRGSSPPFLVMVGGSEEKAMIRQSNRLHEAPGGGRGFLHPAEGAGSKPRAHRVDAEPFRQKDRPGGG